ncbi:hypothetical protein EDD21DRAFT_59467 [Dissophora ornata]|nr:hypothetical protein EDD21DRAFT_59467 [Dissophora ornata]
MQRAVATATYNTTPFVFFSIIFRMLHILFLSFNYLSYSLFLSISSCSLFQVAFFFFLFSNPFIDTPQVFPLVPLLSTLTIAIISCFIMPFLFISSFFFYYCVRG